jgi:O-antigen/teichoic acid export membrane protein
MGKITKNSIALLTKEFVLNLSAIFVVGYLARKLGAEDYGKFTYSISYAIILSIIGNLGIRQFATKEIIRNKDRILDIYNQVVVTRFFLSIIMVITGIIASFFINYSEVLFVLIVIALISKFFFNYAVSNFIIFEATEDMTYNALIQTSSRVVVIILTIIVLFLGYGLFSVALVYLIGDLMQAGHSFYIVRARYFKPRLKVDYANSLAFLRKSAPFAVFSIFYLIYFEISKLMLSPMCGDLEVGIYQAAAVLAYKFLIVSDAIGTAIYPKIIELGKTSLSKYRKLTFKALGFMFGFGFISAVFIYFMADLIIDIIYHSNEYEMSKQILKLIIWVLPFMFVNKIFSFMFQSKDRQNLLAGIYAFMAFVLIITNLILIPEYKAMGAAYSLIISEISGLIWFLIFYKSLGLTTHRQEIQ